MKLERAIEIQTISLDHPYITTNPELREAMELGIEALKRYQQQHRYPYYVIAEPLPGETED